MKKRRMILTEDAPLGEPVRKYSETTKATDVIQKWLRDQGAVESRTFDEETGEPMRTFTIKL